MKKILFLYILLQSAGLFSMLTPRSATILREQAERYKIESELQETMNSESLKAMGQFARLAACKHELVELQRELLKAKNGELFKAKNDNSSGVKLVSSCDAFSATAAATSGSESGFWQESKQELLSTFRTQSISFALRMLFSYAENKIKPKEAPATSPGNNAEKK